MSKIINVPCKTGKITLCISDLPKPMYSIHVRIPYRVCFVNFDNEATARETATYLANLHWTATRFNMLRDYVKSKPQNMSLDDIKAACTYDVQCDPA